MENDKEFAPLSVAAQQAGYTYRMVYNLARLGIIPSQTFYCTICVRPQDALDYKARMQALGTAKHNLRYPQRQEAPDATPTG